MCNYKISVLSQIGAWCRCNLLHGVGATQVNTLQSTQEQRQKIHKTQRMDTVTISTWNSEFTGFHTLYNNQCQRKCNTFCTFKSRIRIHTEIMQPHKRIAWTQYKHSTR